MSALRASVACVDLLPPRIVAKIVVDDASGCWLWAAALDDQGYGRVSWEGRNRKAYRIVWLLLREAIGEGLELDHVCKVRRCVNPDHLEPVTHAENVGRGELGETLRSKYAAPRNCPQGHALEGDNLIVASTKAGHPNRKCRTCRDAAVARFKERKAALARA